MTYGFKTLLNSGLWRATTAFTKISTKWDIYNPSQPSFLHRNLHSLLLGANGISPSVAPCLKCSLFTRELWKFTLELVIKPIVHHSCTSVPLKHLSRTAHKNAMWHLAVRLDFIKVCDIPFQQANYSRKNEIRLAWHSWVQTNPPSEEPCYNSLWSYRLIFSKYLLSHPGNEDPINLSLILYVFSSSAHASPSFKTRYYVCLSQVLSDLSPSSMNSWRSSLMVQRMFWLVPYIL